MAAKDVSAQIAGAWALHREGRNENAIAEFNQALKQAPDNIDALFGLGLAQRSAKMRDAAVKTFTECQALIRKAREANPNEDRFQILARMCSQRLQELGVGTGK